MNLILPTTLRIFQKNGRRKQCNSSILSRSHHESVKNQNAYILTQISDEPIDLNNEFLFTVDQKALTRERILKKFF